MSPDVDVPPPDDIPAVRPAPPVACAGSRAAVLWTLGFAAVLFGSMIGMAVAGGVGMALLGQDPLAGTDLKTGRVSRQLAEIIAVSATLAYLLALGYSLVALRVVNGRGWARKIGLGTLPPTHLALIVIGLPGFMIVSDAVGRLLIGLLGDPSAGQQDQTLQGVFKPLHWSLVVLAIGVMPGLGEELWCRGFLGRGLVGRYGAPLGIVLTSLFFGLLHAWPPWYVLITGVMGAMLHLTYLASRSLWVPITLHLLNNSLTVLAATGVIPIAAQVDVFVAQSPAVAYLLGFALAGFVGIAMWTARVRVVPTDPELPPWEPPFPGVEPPPAGVNAVLVQGRVSVAAVVVSLALLGTLLFLMFR